MVCFNLIQQKGRGGRNVYNHLVVPELKCDEALGIVNRASPDLRCVKMELTNDTGVTTMGVGVCMCVSDHVPRGKSGCPATSI